MTHSRITQWSIKKFSPTPEEATPGRSNLLHFSHKSSLDGPDILPFLSQLLADAAEHFPGSAVRSATVVWCTATAAEAHPDLGLGRNTNLSTLPLCPNFDGLSSVTWIS